MQLGKLRSSSGSSGADPRQGLLGLAIEMAAEDRANAGVELAPPSGSGGDTLRRCRHVNTQRLE